MSLTLSVEEDRGVRLTAEAIETRPPDRIAFAVEGVITITDALLGEFAGATLKPVRVDVSVGSRLVEIDLDEAASLRLESVDVGVKTPDPEDLPPGTDAIRSPFGDASEPPDDHPGTIAFTVEGTIRDVPEETFESLSGANPTLETISFAVEDAVRGDGGSGDDVVFEFALLGYGIVILRNGVIDVGTGSGTMPA